MANLSHIRLYRVGTAAALIVAPLLLLIGNVIHPKEVGRGNELEQVGLIADAYARWQAAHVIGWGIAGELSAHSPLGPGRRRRDAQRPPGVRVVTPLRVAVSRRILDKA
jgi:hypothetical protein